MQKQTIWRDRQLLAAILLISSTLPIATPVLAEGTAAGTSISNTATAEYEDPSALGTKIPATSNTVVVTVTEVAGVTVTAQTPSNPSPIAGENLYVDFVITNTGNDPTQFFIPGTATLSNSTAFTQGQLQVVAVNGTTLGTPINIPNGGATTSALGIGTSGSISPNPGTGNTGTVTVRVPITALTSAASGQITTVALGNTTPVNGQNQDRTVGNINPNDVYTQDNPDGTTGETAGTPNNGVREAMATSSTISIGARPQAFATILKANSGYNNNGTSNVLTDDTLTYGLALKIEDPTTPPAGLVTADLNATSINLDGINVNRVLVADAIPAGTQLSAAAPIAPTGWTVVYSISPTTINANQANWVTTRPASGITRVGFVAVGAIAKGTTVSGFSFSVIPLASFAGGQIANIAQVFGQSQVGASNQIVYDESGDQTPNNGLEGNNPDPISGGAATTNGGINNGVANPATDGIDPGTGTNPTAADTNQGVDTGTGAGTKPGGGEATVYNIAVAPLNGPNNQPGAVGPTDNNDDFTNKSLVPPAGIPPTTVLTDAQTPPVTFTNTVQNTSGSSQPIFLLPTPPATPGDLPNGTIVTIDPDGLGSATPVTFTYNGTSFTGGAAPSITIPAGQTANYTVTINLPNAEQLQGYPVTITAFSDTNSNGIVEPSEPSNRTIDRVYTGYVSLQKQARILDSTGNPVAGPAGSFTTDSTILSAATFPGRMIEYRIQYQNISVGQGTGSNNVILPANNLVIKEDGNTAPNNWFTPTKDPAYPTTPTGSATDSTTGVITVTTSGDDIQIYTNTIATLAPGVSGNMTFRRQIR